MKFKTLHVKVNIKHNFNWYLIKLNSIVKEIKENVNDFFDRKPSFFFLPMMYALGHIFASHTYTKYNIF